MLVRISISVTGQFADVFYSKLSFTESLKVELSLKSSAVPSLSAVPEYVVSDDNTSAADQPEVSAPAKAVLSHIVTCSKITLFPIKCGH